MRSAARQGRHRSPRRRPDGVVAALSAASRAASRPLASGWRDGIPPARLSTARQPGKRGPESLCREKFGGGPAAAAASRVGAEARPRLAAGPSFPLLPSPAPPKFGSPAIFLAPLPCEA